jgi:hypothetical protein
MNMNKVTLLSTLAVVGFFSVPVLAGTALSGEQVRQLVLGNSVEAHSNAKGYDFKAYFATDGSAVSEVNGKAYKGAWRINDSGEHCTQWTTQKETCGQIVNMGDGTYSRMEEGYPRAVWKKVHPGNAFGL